ncbi:MAG: class I SAM-dependent DNA methyltransferase, partial [Gemmatimonadales bacterium]|nr:class I SAM-dependent DNA methyltransferase [Gemmatimonadales bacterium]
RFLDPACGSGNFLYVTMAAVKRIELEVLRELARLHGGQEGLVLDEVHPRQFHGIEVNWWAREIAELTLWIGYHQFWREAHGGRTPPVPILEDTGTIECRDAILAWDAMVHRPEKDRPDPTPRLVHPVTGELVPDPAAKLPFIEYVGARQAEWPKADFIVGNPPFLGQFRQRDALGDGRVDAMRAAYPRVPDSADLVMYWWFRAAAEVVSGQTHRAGLIATQSITQAQNRRVISDALSGGAAIIWAIPDHYWNDGGDDARVRVAMTVLARNVSSATLVRVDGNADVVSVTRVPRLNTDLSAHADVALTASVPLASNQGLCSNGFKLHGKGFVIGDDEARRLMEISSHSVEVLRPFRNGMDIVTRPRGVWVIDFGFLSEEEARRYAPLFDIVRDRVKPERDANAQPAYREFWWRFGRPRGELRDALSGLRRYAVTVKTAKHRLFTFLSSDIAPDDGLTVTASDDAFILGTLSSTIHISWALGAGSQFGIDATPRYDKGPCFEAFPFPTPSQPLRAAIAGVAERIEAHRKSAMQSSPRAGLTILYNVVDKLRSGEALTPKERVIHEAAACGILRDMHDELDALVAEAYGWPWPMEKEEILERLVTLHDERVAEEQRGVIRWLRPEYQIPRFAPGHVAELNLPAPEVVEGVAPTALVQWPSTAVEQLAALQALVGRAPLTEAEAAAAFAGGDRRLVGRHLETLSMLGEVREVAGRFGG